MDVGFERCGLIMCSDWHQHGKTITPHIGYCTPWHLI
jgi:hypothetical protein